MEQYNIEETILIGDSINDLEAASNNNMIFVGYNNLSLKKGKDHYYLDTMADFDKFILDL